MLVIPDSCYSPSLWHLFDDYIPRMITENSSSGQLFVMLIFLWIRLTWSKLLLLFQHPLITLGCKRNEGSLLIRKVSQSVKYCNFFFGQYGELFYKFNNKPYTFSLDFIYIYEWIVKFFLLKSENKIIYNFDKTVKLWNFGIVICMKHYLPNL